MNDKMLQPGTELYFLYGEEDARTGRVKLEEHKGMFLERLNPAYVLMDDNGKQVTCLGSRCYERESDLKFAKPIEQCMDDMMWAADHTIGRLLNVEKKLLPVARQSFDRSFGGDTSLLALDLKMRARVLGAGFREKMADFASRFTKNEVSLSNNDLAGIPFGDFNVELTDEDLHFGNDVEMAMGK